MIDINHAFRSAIVATRGFGSDLDAIERHALTQIEVFQRHGIAATVKHWPGEGYDDRDQHLVTTVNPLDLDEWEATFGRLYRAAIKAGVLSVMSGHIAFPAFVRSLDPAARREAFRPASISQLLNITLLRERLGFNGLIVSDATGMAGLTAWCRIEEAMPQIIAGGCDVILFSDDPHRDAEAVRSAVARGELEQARVDDAVMRVLGFKAALKLHLPQGAVQPGSHPRKHGKQSPRRGDHRALADPGEGHATPAAARSDKTSPRPGRHARHHRALVATPASLRPACHADGEGLRGNDPHPRHGNLTGAISTCSSISSARRRFSRAAASSSTGSS